MYSVLDQNLHCFFGDYLYIINDNFLEVGGLNISVSICWFKNVAFDYKFRLIYYSLIFLKKIKPPFLQNFVFKNTYHLARQSENWKGYVLLQKWELQNGI